MIQTYHYDLAGNLRRLEETGGTGELPSRVLECSYDGANRLTTESDTRGSDPAIGTTYGYDAADNRVSRVITGGPDAGTTSYAIGADNELVSLTRPDSSVVSYGYDATGARVSRTEDSRTDSYAYDTWDRLLSLGLQTPADPALRGSYDYSYDARTRRMWRQELGEGTVLSFIGGVSVQEYDVGSVSTPPAPPSGAPTVEYVRGPDMGGGVGGMLYSVRSGSASLVHSSARGDVIERRAEDGTVNWQAQYEAFGKHPVESGSNPDRQRANSKEEDPTGLLNEGFRYRDLETGTFITRDPIGFKDGPNLYTYVHQNPWTRFDPEGLSFWSAFRSYVESAVVSVAAAVASAVLISATIALAPIAPLAAAATGVLAAVIATAGVVGRGMAAGTIVSPDTTMGQKIDAAAGLLGGLHGSRAGGELVEYGNGELSSFRDSARSAKVDQMQENVMAAGKGKTREATFAQGADSSRTTDVMESTPVDAGRTPSSEHAEMKANSALAGGKSARDIVVDQAPCESCVTDLRSLPPGSRVFGPDAPLGYGGHKNQNRSNKMFMRDAANSRVEPRWKEYLTVPGLPRQGVRAAPLNPIVIPSEKKRG